MPNNITPRQQQANQLQQRGSQLAQFLASKKKQIEGALPKHMTADRCIRMALTAASKVPKLLECSMESVALSLLQCSQFGLEVNGRDAYLVPYKGVCTLVVSYMGYIQLAYRSGVVKSIKAHAVYAKDTFEYSEGSDEHLTYRAFDGDGDPGPLTHAWAMCKLMNGGEAWVVLNKRQIMERKKHSQNPGNWDKFPEAYWAKTAVRALAKFMPQMAELDAFHRVVEEDEPTVIDTTPTDNQTNIVDAALSQEAYEEPEQPLTAEEASLPPNPPTADEQRRVEAGEPVNETAEQLAPSGDLSKFAADLKATFDAEIAGKDKREGQPLASKFMRKIDALRDSGQLTTAEHGTLYNHGFSVAQGYKSK